MTGNGVTTDYHFAPVPEALLYDVDLSDKAVRVYACLLRHGMTKDDCYPSHARIADLIGCAKRSVQRPLVELEQAGWITRVPRFDRRGDRMSDGYEVHTSATSDAPPAQENADPPALDDVDPPRDGTRTGEGEPLNDSHLEREEPPSDGALFDAGPPASAPPFVPAEIAAMFERFWARYPRKTGKAAAAKAFDKAVRAHGAEPIAAGYRAHLVAWSTWPPGDVQFIPHAATWLNGERWQDIPEQRGATTGPKSGGMARAAAMGPDVAGAVAAAFAGAGYGDDRSSTRDVVGGSHVTSIEPATTNTDGG